MGLTESNLKQGQIEANHKLIRRYNSEAYGDLTVVQDKQDQKMWALKEIVAETNALQKMIIQRKSMNHRSLVSLKQYWFQGDQSFCSNFRSTCMIFEYFPRSLEEEIQLRGEKDDGHFGDWQVLQILGDSLDCLKYLESMGSLYLIPSLRAILYDEKSKTVKLLQNQQMLIYSNKSKKINTMALLSHKKMLPLHPLNEPRDSGDSCIDQYRVAHQNIFILAIACLSLCFLRDPIQLGILSKGAYDFKKISKRVNQISKKFPNTYSVLSVLLLGAPEQIKYIDALKQINHERRSFTKENRSSRAIEIQPVQKVKRNKKLPEMRCNNPVNQ